MPNTKTAEKRMKQAEKRRLRNRMYKGRVKKAVRDFEATLKEGDREKALEAYSRASKELDKAASRGVLHKRTAARKKSRLAQQINTLAS